MTPPRWYHVALYRLEAAWLWVTGLRVSTRERRRLELEVLDRQIQWLKILRRDVERAMAEKRQAERLVALLSEPLKDWDLDGFPDPSALRRGAADRLVYPLNPGGARHLSNVVETYRLLSRDLAHVRMTATTNDSARRRGWDDQPLPSAPRTTLDPRRLP